MKKSVQLLITGATILTATPAFAYVDYFSVKQCSQGGVATPSENKKLNEKIKTTLNQNSAKNVVQILPLSGTQEGSQFCSIITVWYTR
jgi:hypothetical protein